DPDGAIVAGMLSLNARADEQFLTLVPAAMPMLDDKIVVAAPERPKIAAAPDFEYRPSRGEIPTPDFNELAPMSIEEFGATGDEMSGTGSDAAAFSLDDLGDLPEGLEPITIEELGGLPGETASTGFFDGNFDIDLSALDTPSEDEAPAPFTLEEVLQSESPAFNTEMSAEAQPNDDHLLFAEPTVPHEPADIVIDDLAALAASLEGDVADALNRAGEPVDAATDVEASRPPDAAPRGYTTVLRGLEDQGLAPFDPRSREPVGGMPSMLDGGDSAADEATLAASAGPVAAQETVAQTDEFGKITRDWDTIDDEIQAAMPVTSGHGYTDELRSLDEIGLMPFEVEEDAKAFEGVTPFNPFASEPVVPMPAPAPIAMPEPMLAGDEPELSAGLGTANPATDELFGGLEPFAFEEFDSGQAPTGDAQSRSFFGQSGWQGSSSIIPSDADLDTLLAFEDDEPVSMSGPETAQTTQTAHDEPVPPAGIIREAEPVNGALGALQTPPSLSDADLDEFFESSGAVTRQLPGEATHPMLQTDRPMPGAIRPEATQPDITSGEHDLSAVLRPNTEVFTRARAVKLGLMSEGRISGTRELGEGITTDELIAMEDRLKTQNLPEADADAFDDDDDDDLIAGTGATRDTTTLRAALEVTPDDDELRWWLAEALRDRGDLDDASIEYRWLIRHAPHRHEQILTALTESVEHGQMPETAHRLLGDIYRRRGDVTRASNHAALALQVRRRSGRAL
ncbi:MAG: hypothetical protein M3439_02115, partial [Chloroflexota bacterium]|nr:hypothetical protein [Chloroflexota bacterium]